MFFVNHAKHSKNFISFISEMICCKLRQGYGCGPLRGRKPRKNIMKDMTVDGESSPKTASGKRKSTAQTIENIKNAISQTAIQATDDKQTTIIPPAPAPQKSKAHSSKKSQFTNPGFPEN